jgi:hypothetical protein
MKRAWEAARLVGVHREALFGSRVTPLWMSVELWCAVGDVSADEICVALRRNSGTVELLCTLFMYMVHDGLNRVEIMKAVPGGVEVSAAVHV